MGLCGHTRPSLLFLETQAIEAYSPLWSGAKHERRRHRRPTPPHFGQAEGGVVMDTRIYEKGSRAGPLWAALVALMFGLGLAWAIGA